MAENESVVNTDSGKPSKMKPVVVLAVGGFLLLVIGLALQFFVKKAGTSLMDGVIENKTGVKTNLEDGEQLPDTFPKDFPIYQGAKVAASVSNTQQGKGNGFLVTFTTSDGLDKVVPFYKNGLSIGGWTITSSFDSDTIQTWVIVKGTTEGSVSITSEKNQTTIVVALGEKE